MRLPPGIRQVESALHGWPDRWLTVLIIAISVAGLLVALKAPIVIKAAWAAWELAP